MTSKRGKNKKVAHVVQPSVSLIVDSGVIFAPSLQWDEPIKMYDSAYSTNSNNLHFFSEFLLTRITDIFRKIIWKHILLNINLCLINFCPGENSPRSTSTFAWNQRQTLQCTYKPARGVLPMTGILLCSCVRFPLRQFTRHKCSLNILEFSSNECL